MRWPEGPPHLALNPPYFFFCFCFFFVLLFFVAFFGGFNGQVRRPEGPPHLALNPPYLFLLFLLFCFLFFVFWFLIQQTLFSPRKGHFLYIFSVSLSPLAFLCLPLFLFLFLCLSLFFFSFFLPSCLSFLIFLAPCFCLFLSFSFFFASLSWKEQHQNIKLQVLSSSFCFLVSCLLFVSSSFFLSLLFPDFKLCFLFNIKVFDFQTNNLKKQELFGQKGGCNKTVFFLSTCVLENVKSYRFLCPFWGKFWVMFKKHYKIGISAHF